VYPNKGYDAFFGTGESMSRLLVIGGGLFGSPAAAYARHKGLETLVFDAGLPGAASQAAAGLISETWTGRKLRESYQRALPVLDLLYGLRRVSLAHDDGSQQLFWFVPPRAILEPAPVRQRVTSVGDGWLEAGGRRYEGWVYVTAGIWSGDFAAGLNVRGKAGASFLFTGERAGRIRLVTHGRQALVFVRDPGTTYFSDGTAEAEYTAAHDRETLNRAACMGLVGEPLRRCWGVRPYTSGGPVFLRLSKRTWLATGGRKMGTILGAAFARRLVEEELR
jgi:glycine/D-amino acid oxidase-like deaminating enzyme